jgi:hypothetical protein
MHRRRRTSQWGNGSFPGRHHLNGVRRIGKRKRQVCSVRPEGCGLNRHSVSSTAAEIFFGPFARGPFECEDCK